MLIDSHCHLVSHKYQDLEIAKLIKNAEQAGVTQMITLATSLKDAPKHLDLAKKHSAIFAALGIHPCDVHETPNDYLQTLKPLAEQKECVAIGETGLDYYHPAPEGFSEETYHQRQRDFLQQHFALAAELKKNIVIHTRDKSGNASLLDALAIYQDWHEQVQAVFHCFLGPLSNAKKIFDLGGLISFTGIATFKSAKDCLEAATNAPKGSFMLETDSPYLAPAPHRGKRCEPAYTALTAQHIANARKESIEELATHTSTTAKQFYQLDLIC